MMSEWISIKDRPPKSGQKVRIKTFDIEDNPIEIDVIFEIRDIDEHSEAWVWKIGKHNTTARPTHWKPTPEPPNE